MRCGRRCTRAGAPVQYAHRAEQLPLYAVQTAYAARPWAAEMPSAGRPLTWDVLLGLRRAGVEIATLTHAAGLSSTGDAALDRALPWPERYEIPRAHGDAIARDAARGGRVIAVGTTVVRALEASGAASARSAPARASRRCGSMRRTSRASSTGSSAGCTCRARVTSSCCARSRRATGWRARSRSRRAHGLSSHELGDACLILPR